jgi:hypothetical protein
MGLNSGSFRGNKKKILQDRQQRRVEGSISIGSSDIAPDGGLDTCIKKTRALVEYIQIIFTEPSKISSPTNTSRLRYTAQTL